MGKKGGGKGCEEGKGGKGEEKVCGTSEGEGEGTVAEEGEGEREGEVSGGGGLSDISFSDSFSDSFSLPGSLRTLETA